MSRAGRRQASPNDRLRRAVFDARLTPQQLARTVEVDPKTVERWITQGRIPYPVHQFAVAVAVGVPEKELWPDPFQPRIELLAQEGPQREHSGKPAPNSAAVTRADSAAVHTNERFRELMSWVDVRSPLHEREMHPSRDPLPERYSRTQGVQRTAWEMDR
ncbi:hypothetical protein [Nocardia sp. NPDC057030]|uniref:hypothetical protein n=1 Tax=unclassified Nocardia TaxID=2637762 RepID=UPI003625D479